MDPYYKQYPLHQNPNSYSGDPRQQLYQPSNNFIPTSPQQYASNSAPANQYLEGNPPMNMAYEFMREQTQAYLGPGSDIPRQGPLSRHSMPDPEWDCLHCDHKFYTELERDQHLHVCLQKPKFAEPEPFYESIDNPVQLPKVLLFWTKERATLEKEVQLFTQDGKGIGLLWSELDARFQTETQLSAGEHDGLLSVNDINLSADIHTFYVAPYQRGAKMQRIELAIDDEKEVLLRESPEEEKEKEGMDKLNKPKNKLKKRNSKMLVGTDGELAPKNIPIDDAKKFKTLQKENDKLTAELRDQIKKLTEENHKLKKQIENISKAGETKREQLEGEKQALLGTIQAFKKESDQKKVKSQNNKGMNDVLERSKSLLDIREKENIDLSQQLASLQMITGIQETRLREQQEEVVEKREKVIELENTFGKLKQEFAIREEDWHKESADFEHKLRECVLKGEMGLDEAKKELDKSRMICDSLQEEKDKLREELLLNREATASLPLERVKNTQECVKLQLERLEKERDELVLINRANVVDLDEARDRLRLETERKTEIKKPRTVTPDPEISKFFQNTIKRKDEELEELKHGLTELRENNLRLEKEKGQYFEQLESYKGFLIPRLRTQIQNLQANQFVPTVNSLETESYQITYNYSSLRSPTELDNSLLSNKGETISLPIPIAQIGNQDVESDQKCPLTPNYPAPAPVKATAKFLQDLPPPLHLQKKSI